MKAIKSLASLNEEMTKTHSVASKAAQGIGFLSVAANSLSKAALTAFGTIQGIKAFSDMGIQVASLNKKMFDISKTTKITGESFDNISKSIQDVNKNTHLSIVESTEFFRTMQRGQRGVRLTASETGQLAKVLSAEYGPSLRDVSEGLQDLLSLQSKEVNVLRRIQSGMSPKELQAYGATLIMMHGATEKEIEALVRATRAYRDKDEFTTKSERKNRELADSVQDLTKAGSDLVIEWGRPMADMMQSISKHIVSLKKFLGDLTNSPTFRKILEFAPLIGTVAAAAGTTATVMGGTRLLGLGRGRKNQEGGGSGGGSGLGAIPGIDLIRGGVPVWVINQGSSGLMSQGTPGTQGKNKGPEQAPVKGGMGWKGRVGMGVGGLALGVAGNMAGGIAEESGYGRVGAGTRAASNMGSGALMGFAMGGPLGAALGAAAGALSSWSDLATAIVGVTEEEEKAKKAISDRTDAERKTADFLENKGIKGTREQSEFQETYSNYMKPQFGNKEFSELGTEDKSKAMRQMQARSETGVDMGQTTRQLAVAIRTEMAKSIAQKQATDKGLSGKDAEEFVGKTVSEFKKGITSPAFSSAIAAGLSSAPIFAEMQSRASQKTGLSADKDSLNKVMNEEASVNSLLSLKQIEAEMSQIKMYSDATVSSSLQIAEINARMTGDVSKAAGEYQAASDAIKDKREGLERVLKQLKSMTSWQNIEGAQREEIRKTLGLTSMTESEISQHLSDQTARLGMINQIRAEISRTAEGEADVALSKVRDMKEQEAVQASRIGLLKSELELSKALYLGLGPTLDKQMQLSNELQTQKEKIQDQIDSIRAQGPEVLANTKIQRELLDLEQKQNSLEMERLNITKNLREAYLQQMTAFTNVQGAFSKIILTQEEGAGEILRQFGGPGSSKMGALGAGSNAPVARLKAGGGIDYMGPEQQKEAFDRYNRDMPEMLRTRISEAGAAQETGEEQRLRGEDLERQTGEKPWRGGRGRFKEGGIVPGSGSGDIVPAMLEPGELVVPKNMAKGIRGFKDGGVAGAPGYRVVGTGGDQIITAQLEQLIKLSMRTVDVLEKGVVQSKKSDEEQTRRDKVADQSKDRKRLEPDEKDVGKAKKEKEEWAKSKAMQKEEEDKLMARQEEWMDYFNKQSSDVIMESVNTSGLGIGNKAGHRVTGVDQQVKADRRGTAENYREEVKETWNQKQAREKKQREEEQASKEEKTLGEAASRPETYQKAESEYQQAQFNQENAQRQLALNKDIQKKHKGLSASGGGMSIFSRMDARDYLTGRPMSPEGKDRIENGAMIEGDPAMSVATTKQAKGEDEAARLKKELKRKRQEIKNTERSVEQNEKGTNVGNTGFGWAAPTQLPSLDMEGTVADQMLSGVKESWSNTLAKTIRDIDVPAFDFAGIRIGGGGQGKGAQTAQWEKKLLKAQKSEAEELEKKLKQAEEMTKAGKDEQEALKKGYAEKAKKREEEQKAIDESVKTAEHAVKLAGRDVSIAEGKRRSAKEEYEESKKSLEQARAGPEKTERKGRTAGIYEGGSLSTTPYQKKEAGIYKDGSLQDVKKKAGIYEGDGQIARPRSKKEAGIYEGESLSPTPMPKKEGEDNFRMKMEDGKWQKELIDTNKEQTKKVTEHAATGKKQVQLQENAAKATASAKETLEGQQDRKPVEASSIGSRDDMDKAIVSAIQGSIFGTGMAKGGIVPGSGSGDRVPAMLEPGEFVVPKAIMSGVRGYRNGGVVSPSPTLALASSGTGASPQIALNVRGDSVNGIMKSVQGQLAGVLNKMMSPSGTSGRFFDLTQSG